MTTAAPRQGDAPRRVLVFCRPYLVPDFRENVAPLAAEFDFHFLTDGHSPGTPDTRADFYANLRANHRCSELSAADEADVTARCRLMRNIDPAQARNMAHAMAGALAKALDAARPAIVLSHMVDDYVTHLLSKLAQKRHILFAGYAYSYFPGLIQLTAFSNGTALRLREPGDDEVDTVVQTISQRVYRQNYLQRDNYTLARHVKGILRYSVKRVVFALKARLESDPWHLHYAVTPFLVERRRLRDFPGRGEFHADWAATLAAARQAKPGAVVYLPLGYFPESTIDYWITNTRILRYEDTLLGFVRALARDHVVVVKEHLHMMGARDCRLYRALMAIPNVVSVHPMEFSNDVLAASDAVVLGGGSVGVEATLRDKPIFSFCDTSYWYRAARAGWLDLDDVDAWAGEIQRGIARARPLDDEAKRGFIRECLRSTARPRSPGRRWPHIQLDDLRRLLATDLPASRTLPAALPITSHATIE